MNLVSKIKKNLNRILQVVYADLIQILFLLKILMKLDNYEWYIINIQNNGIKLKKEGAFFWKYDIIILHIK